MSGANQIELGLTIPLQRHLGIKALSYSEEPDRRFCWDLHVIPLRGGLPCWQSIVIAGIPSYLTI